MFSYPYDLSIVPNGMYAINTLAGFIKYVAVAAKKP